MYVRALKCTHRYISESWSPTFCSQVFNFEFLINLLVIHAITFLRLKFLIILSSNTEGDQGDHFQNLNFKQISSIKTVTIIRSAYVSKRFTKIFVFSSDMFNTEQTQAYFVHICTTELIFSSFDFRLLHVTTSKTQVILLIQKKKAYTKII